MVMVVQTTGLRHLPQQLMARQWVSTMVAATDTFNYELQLLHNSMCLRTMLLIKLFVFITFASLLISPIGKNLKFARDIFIYIHNIYIHKSSPDQQCSHGSFAKIAVLKYQRVAHT